MFRIIIAYCRDPLCTPQSPCLSSPMRPNRSVRSMLRNKWPIRNNWDGSIQAGSKYVFRFYVVLNRWQVKLWCKGRVDNEALAHHLPRLARSLCTQLIHPCTVERSKSTACPRLSSETAAADLQGDHVVLGEQQAQAPQHLRLGPLLPHSDVLYM
jgi:hypothetical protein